jgi:hypothetical protein
VKTTAQYKKDVVLSFSENPDPPGEAPYATIGDILNRGRWSTYRLGGQMKVNGKPTHIEVKPQADWFVKKTINGKQYLFLKFECTGVQPLYFGPYRDKDTALFALSSFIDRISEDLMNPPSDEALEVEIEKYSEAVG